MQEKDGRAAAGGVVGDFGVIRTDDLHATIISTCVTARTPVSPEISGDTGVLAVTHVLIIVACRSSVRMTPKSPTTPPAAARPSFSCIPLLRTTNSFCQFHDCYRRVIA